MRSMEVDNLFVLSRIYRYTPSILSMYESTHLWHGRGILITTGIDGSKRLSSGRIDGVGIDLELSMSAWAAYGDQWELLVVLFSMSVIKLMITHHSRGLQSRQRLALGR